MKIKPEHFSQLRALASLVKRRLVETAGDYLRRKFRAEFGSAMQRRWFD